ncbi:hypothetical protein LTR78_010086 [Recurvomyces mirabilis]|uniref:Uncharacterized protein n=1 Tax=Recurvomyces mirabilis TaxID=574656 RepID=A0AAE0TNG1_9PEZI|nr:hypothetical protein LTR78_010086 [Recurvomyces mirabilis]KAK5159808.1 hypothetical protein LTS14_001913 [Recurvomyces mirabilis]
MSQHKRPATFSDQSGTKNKSARRAVGHSRDATRLASHNNFTSDLRGSTEPVDVGHAHEEHQHEFQPQVHSGPRCSTPESLPSLENGSDGIADESTLSEDEDAATIGSPKANALLPSTAPHMPRHLNAQSLQLHNTMSDAACEDDEFDNAQPILAWDMSLDDPWSLMKVRAGYGPEWHEADLQMRLADMEAAILRKN